MKSEKVPISGLEGGGAVATGPSVQFCGVPESPPPAWGPLAVHPPAALGPPWQRGSRDSAAGPALAPLTAAPKGGAARPETPARVGVATRPPSLAPSLSGCRKPAPPAVAPRSRGAAQVMRVPVLVPREPAGLRGEAGCAPLAAGLRGPEPRESRAGRAVASGAPRGSRPTTPSRGDAGSGRLAGARSPPVPVLPTVACSTSLSGGRVSSIPNTRARFTPGTLSPQLSYWVDFSPANWEET